MIEIKVLDEERGATITLYVTEDDYARIHAEPDQRYLRQLISNYYENGDNVQNSQEQTEENGVNEDGNESQQAAVNVTPNEDRSIFIWSNECVLLLLSLYEAVDDWQMKRHKKNYDEIATQIINTNPAYLVNGSQCQSKIASLKKNYKKIKDHNGTSGNDRLTWPFYERMDEIFGNRGWIRPCAVASEAGPGPEEVPPQSENTTTQNNTRKRRIETIMEDILESGKARHQERKEILKQFLDIKKQQHEEKMNILKELCQNLTNNNK